MASYVLEEFLGGGVLKDMGVKFADDGWDDVPTLKVIGAADMEALDLTDAQRDALELRIHLHNRSLMKYADRMEASGIGLIDLMAMRPSQLASSFKMRKTQVAQFVNTTIACGLPASQFDLLPRETTVSRLSEDSRQVLVKGKPLYKPPPFELHKSTLSESSFGSSFGSSPPRKSNASSYFGFRSKSSPPRKSNAAAGDMGYKNSYAKLSPPRKSSAGELRTKNSFARPAPARTSSVGELGFHGSPFAGSQSPPRMSNVADIAKLFSPARKSNAGSEFGFNPFGKASPPRKSNAGELAANGNPSPARRSNYVGKLSPPRRSNAGDRASPPRRSNYAGKASPPRRSNAGELGFNGNGDVRNSTAQAGFEPPAKLRPAQAVRPYAPRGVLSATNSASKRQLCGVVKAPSSSDTVAKLSDLEGVMVRQLAPEHSFGVDSRKLKGGRRDPPFKAYNLWAEKPTLFFCIRRPGCVMCRAEAHQLFARKPIFDALGVQLVAVLLEDIDEEVWSFWPRYWAGMVVLDQNRDLFRALGGGKLMKESLFKGFILNPIARLNWKRAVKSGIPYNTRGEGLIKGGMLIVRRGRGGVAYQFAEKNFGDWAPLDEVLQVCHSIKEEGD